MARCVLAYPGCVCVFKEEEKKKTVQSVCGSVGRIKTVPYVRMHLSAFLSPPLDSKRKRGGDHAYTYVCDVRMQLLVSCADVLMRVRAALSCPSVTPRTNHQRLRGRLAVAWRSPDLLVLCRACVRLCLLAPDNLRLELRMREWSQHLVIVVLLQSSALVHPSRLARLGSLAPPRARQRQPASRRGQQ